MGPFSSLLSTSLCTHFIPSCRSLVTIVDICKSDSSSILIKRFRLIVVTSSGLKPAGRAVQRCLTSSTGVPNHPFQITCKLNRCTLDAVATLVDYISTSLYPSSESVWCAFLDFSCSVDFIPWSLLLHRTWTVRLSQWPLSMAIRLIHQQNLIRKTGTKKSAALISNSWAFQWAVLSSHLFSAYISDLHTSFLGHIFTYADGFALCHSVPGPEDLLEFATTTCFLFMVHLFALTQTWVCQDACNIYLPTHGPLVRLALHSLGKNRSFGQNLSST